MNRFSRTIFALVMAGAVVVRADDPSTARIALDSAERQLTGATNDAIAARRELDYALTNQRQAADQARNAASTLDQLRLVLDDPGALDRALAEVRVAAQLVTEHTAGLQQARDRLDSAAVTVDQYRAQARTNFENNAAYVQARRQLDAAQARLDNSTDWSLWQLENDPDYQQLSLAASYLRTRVEFLRNWSRSQPEALARTSENWLAAQNRLGAYEQWWIDNDALVANAKGTLAQSKQQFNRLDGQYNVQLAADPRLAELIAMRDVEQQNVAAAAEAFEQARSREGAARGFAATMEQRLTLARQQYQQLQSELDSTYQALDQAASSVGNADSRYRDVLDRQDRAAIERDRAFRDLRRAQDDSVRLRDERDRVVRIERDATNSSDAAANRDRDRTQRNQTVDDGRTRTLEIPPVVPPQQGAPPPSMSPRETPNRPPLVEVRPDQPRPAEPRRETDSQQRIDDAIRRSTDDASSGRPADDGRDRSPGTYRPAAGSVR